MSLLEKVTPEYLGRTPVTLSLLALLELNVIFSLKFHSEDNMKILWIKYAPTPSYTIVTGSIQANS